MIKNKRLSKSQKANLIFSVSRIQKKLKTSQYLKRRRLSAGAAVYTTAVLEYLACELLELAGSNAKLAKRKLITPRHILIALLSDQEIKESFSNIIIPQGGVVPKVNPFLFPKLTQTPKLKRALDASTNSNKHNDKKKSSLSPLRKTLSYSILAERAFELGKKLCVVKGDITELAVDAVVHPTSNCYSTGGMVGSVLASKGGASYANLLNDLRSKQPLSRLEAFISPAYGIKAQQIIHVNGPSYGSDKADSISGLEKCVMNCIRQAESHNLAKMALPSIGSGHAGYPKQLAAQTILGAIRNHLRNHASQSSLDCIYFVLYDDQTIKIFQQELAKLD